MPQLPRINSTVAPRSTPLSISAAEAPGEAAARLGEDVSGIASQFAEQQIQLRRTAEVSQKTAAAAQSADDFYQKQLDQPDHPDGMIGPPQSLTDRVDAGLKAIRDTTVSSIKDPAARTVVSDNLNGILLHHHAAAMTEQRSRDIDSANLAVSDANDTLAKLAAGTSGPQQDVYTAQIHGNIAAAVANHQMTPEEGNKQLDSYLKQIDVAQKMDLIRNNPAQALLDIPKDDNLMPVEKQTLLDHAQVQLQEHIRQQGVADRLAQEEVQKQRKFLMESKITQFQADLTPGTPGYGTATLPRLVEMQQQFNDGKGEPIPYETFARLYDNTLKIPKDRPSDPAALSNVDIAVNSTNPPSMTWLKQQYDQGNLSLEDYTKSAITLERNRRELDDKSRSIQNEQRTQDEKVITNDFGGDKQIYGSALKDLISGTPLEQIEQKYQKAYKVATVNGFNSARNAYDTAVNHLNSWQQSYWGMHASDRQDLRNEVVTKTNEFLAAAKKANRILRPAAPSVTDGTQWTQPDGVHVIAVGGQVIAQ